MTWLLEQIHAHATRCPDRIAVDDGDHSLTYAALWRQITELSAALGDHGVGRLALTGGNCIGWLTADLAAQHRGLTVVPVPPSSARDSGNTYSRMPPWMPSMTVTRASFPPPEPLRARHGATLAKSLSPPAAPASPRGFV